MMNRNIAVVGFQEIRRLMYSVSDQHKAWPLIERVVLPRSLIFAVTDNTENARNFFMSRSVHYSEMKASQK